MPCPQGTFSRNGDLCNPCLVGYITTEEGAERCVPCPAGSTSDATHTECVLCDDGFTSVEGGVCTECLPGSTSRSGGPCEPCPLGHGDTQTEAGVCTACPPNHSSIDGGVCLKCPIGHDAEPGGPCRPCRQGYSTNKPGEQCSPCPSGTSSTPGSSCYDCPAGQISFVSGNCTECPAGFSSVQGSDTCFACEFGQTSLPGGGCSNRCPDGQAWSQAFQMCMVCPTNTQSLSGSTSCYRCGFGTFAPEESAYCYPNDVIAMVMRIDTPFSQVDEQSVFRQLANLVDAELDWFIIYGVRPGSTILYFSIIDPPEDEILEDDSDVRKLSGPEKSVLLYEWWAMNSKRISELEFEILDFKEFIRKGVSSGTPGETTQVLTLFAPTAPTPSQIIPPQPFIRTGSQGAEITLQSRLEGELQGATILLSLTVGSAASLLVVTKMIVVLATVCAMLL